MREFKRIDLKQLRVIKSDINASFSAVANGGAGRTDVEPSSRDRRSQLGFKERVSSKRENLPAAVCRHKKTVQQLDGSKRHSNKCKDAVIGTESANGFRLGTKLL